MRRAAPSANRLPLGGKARSAKGAHHERRAAPSANRLPLGGKARSAKGAHHERDGRTGARASGCAARRRGHRPLVLDLALARHRREGVHPAPARPPDLRDDRRDPGHPARAVRLRDQLRPEAPADGAPRSRPQRVRARDRQGAGEHRLFPLRRSGGERGGSRPDAGGGRSAVRRDDSRRFRATARPRRAARRARRRRRHRSDGHRERDGLAVRGRADRAGRRARRPARAAGGEARRVRVRRARALQPRGDLAVQRRAGTDRGDPDDDDGADHGPRDHPRARARDDGEPPVDAGDGARGDDRQDRPLRRDRARPGDARAAARQAHLRGARCRGASSRSTPRCCCSSRRT